MALLEKSLVSQLVTKFYTLKIHHCSYTNQQLDKILNQINYAHNATFPAVHFNSILPLRLDSQAVIPIPFGD